MAQTTPRASGLEPPDAEIFLADIAKECHARGWALGTSGNFSAVVRREPFVLAITGTGLHKGTLSPDNFVRVDANGSVVEGTGSPSAETAFTCFSLM
jgi:methylthioribulose-1-phosphate dehydratase